MRLPTCYCRIYACEPIPHARNGGGDRGERQGAADVLPYLALDHARQGYRLSS